MKTLKSFLLTLVMALVAVAAHAQQSVVVNGNNVCIRSSPDVDADNKLAHANKGATFEYIGTYGSFYCINYKGQYGYVHKSYSYLKNATAKSNTTAKKQQFVYVTGNSVRIRTAPSTSGGILGSANKGDSFVYLGVTNGWYKIKFGGQVAYISADFATM